MKEENNSCLCFAIAMFIVVVVWSFLFFILQRDRINEELKRKRQNRIMQPTTDCRPSSGRKNQEESRPLMIESPSSKLSLANTNYGQSYFSFIISSEFLRQKLKYILSSKNFFLYQVINSNLKASILFKIS